MSSLKKMIMMGSQNKRSVFWNQGVNGCVDSTYYNNADYNPEPSGYGYRIGYGKYQSMYGYRFAYNGNFRDTAGAINTNHIYVIRRVLRVDASGDVVKIHWYACSDRQQNYSVSEDVTSIEIRNIGLYDRPSWLYAVNASDAKVAGWKGYVECQIYDLTLMFGAGNEPTTVEEFHQRIEGIPVDIYAYNPGEIIEW